MRGLCEDAHPSLYRGRAPEPRPEPVVKGNGWVDELPQKPPEGIELVDRIANHFADLDRAELVKKLVGPRGE
jgi:hypothetical protein